MNLEEFNFPELNQVDIVFSTIETSPELLEKAKMQGMDDYLHPYNMLANHLFNNGGQVILKKGVSEEYSRRALNYIRALAHSFAPKHEDKLAVMALVLSSLTEIESYPELSK